MPVSPGLNVVAAVSTIGSFVFSGIGLGHLFKDSAKHPSTIIEEARQELSSALAILNTFHTVIQDDYMVPLVGRYEK
jgi:hypothetical protein